MAVFYYITDRRAFAGDESARRRLLLAKIAEAARCGVDYIQLREKDLSGRELEKLARAAVTAVGENQGRTEDGEQKTVLLINSRTDVALISWAGGVHLRSNDVAPQEVRRVWEQAANSERGPVISVSCHSPGEVAQAVGGADLAIFAPVFEKKDDPAARPTRLAALREACGYKIPVLALGGVTAENARACLEAGAVGIAAIRLFQENEIVEVLRSLRQ